MGSVHSNNSVNILNNPFVVLGVEPFASNIEILEALQDALIVDPSLENTLNNAKQNLFNPRLRIDAELSILIDTPLDERRSIISRLRSNPEIGYLRHALLSLPPLSRCNLVAHISATGTPDADLLATFVDAQARIAIDDIMAVIDEHRKVAGVVKTDRNIVRESINRLGDLQSEAIFDGYKDPETAANDAQSCVIRVLLQPGASQTEALETLLRGYRRRIAPDLSGWQQNIEAASKDLRNDPANSGALSKLVSALSAWDSLGRPFQLLEAHKGRDEPEARSIYQGIRSLAIDLANDHDRFEIALAITRANENAFGNLPRASGQIAEDLATLKERVEQSGAEPLLKFISEIDGELKSLATDLKASGFTADSFYLSGKLFAAFLSAIIRTRATAAKDFAWIILRGVAIRLNNETEDAVAALALLEGMLVVAEKYLPTEEIVQKLRADCSSVNRSIIQIVLVNHLKTGRNSQALKTVSKLIPGAETTQEKTILENTKSILERKRNATYVRWSIFGAIGLVILFGIFSDKKTIYYLPATSSSQILYQPPSQPIPLPELSVAYEIAPPVGSSINIDRSSVRYCKFQQVRLEFARSLITDDLDKGGFNRAIDDWNSRCSSYRYRPSDLSAVEAELFAKQSELKAQARRMIGEWATGPSPSLPSQEKNPTPISPAIQRPPSASPPATLSPPISPPNQSPIPIQSPTSKPIDLLNIEEAALVQKRLAELGFFTGPANGTWGPLSRSALRSFKLASSLSSDDMLDSATRSRLFSAEAVRASQGAKKPSPTFTETTYPPTNGSNLNPLNKDAAVRIHTRLRELGFYKGKNDVLWSQSSRIALRDFKIKRGLPSDDIWDGQTEQSLFDDNLARFLHGSEH